MGTVCKIMVFQSHRGKKKLFSKWSLNSFNKGLNGKVLINFKNSLNAIINGLWITGYSSGRKIKYIFVMNSIYSKKLNEKTRL